MKLKLLILFFLVFGAIGQTIFLNIDAKSNFLGEDSNKVTNSYVHDSKKDNDSSVAPSSEVVVTIRQHSSKIDLRDINQNVYSDTEKARFNIEGKKPCTQKAKQQRLICQKAKETAKSKNVSGSNHLKSSTIQSPAP